MNQDRLLLLLNDTNTMSTGGDEMHYDTPWEYTCPAPLTPQRTLVTTANLTTTENSTYDRLWEATSGGAVAVTKRSPSSAAVAKRSPLVETVFCSQSTSLVAPSLRQSKSEQRNKLIQQVCLAGSSSPRPLVAPPPPRRARGRVDLVHIIDTPKCSSIDISSSTDQQQQQVYDIPWEYRTKRLLLPPPQPSTANVIVDKDTNGSGGRFDRKRLTLSLGCAALNPTSLVFDQSLPLDRQSWFHGNISRVEAERRLSKSTEGTFLVRHCERNKNEYALSLKSARGYMHMKIQLKNDKWVLGGCVSHPFDRIPGMIHFYSRQKLPIKGAEHMCLLHPLADNLL